MLMINPDDIRVGTDSDDNRRNPTLREGVLSEAASLITGDRNQTYGSPTQNFTDIAEVWNVLLRAKLSEGNKITPGEVAAMMAGVKLVRMIAQPKRDNWVDLAGYAACGLEADVQTGRINEPTEQVSYDNSLPEQIKFIDPRCGNPNCTWCNPEGK
jgi:hypothetical protein